MELASKSIKAGEPVWFGCDVSKYFSRKRGLLTMDLFDFELVFGTKVNVGLSKADRLVYGDCAMNHGKIIQIFKRYQFLKVNFCKKIKRFSA